MSPLSLPDQRFYTKLALVPPLVESIMSTTNTSTGSIQKGI